MPILPETPANDDLLLRGGDVEIVRLELWTSQHSVPFDLTNVWSNISIFEDVELDYIRGEVTIDDSLNVLMDAPILGNEKLVVEFKTPSRSEPLKFIGHVTEVDNRIAMRQGLQVYVIRFISPEFVRNQKTQFSKAYHTMLISDMVSDVYTNYLSDIGSKPLNIASTKNITSRVIPTLSPFRAINWLAKDSQSPSYPTGASFVFFENQHGYYFGPLEALVDRTQTKTPAAVYTKNIVHAQETNNKNILRGFFNIQSLKVKSPDVVKLLDEGVYASKGLSHDLVLRSTETTNFNYFDSYTSMTHTAPNSPGSGMGKSTIHNDERLGRYSDSHQMIIPQHYSAFDDGSASNISGQLEQVRQSQMAQFGMVQLEIEVAGDSDRTIGEVVDIKLPAVGTTTLQGREGEQDKYLSGRYLIAALRHEVIRDPGGIAKYGTIMTVAKDSFETPLPAQLITHWR